MRKQRMDGHQTRKKLLAAASEIFAKKGFWETTNADICQMADVNTASVNYHFGGKENLYVQAWKHAFDESITRYPPDGGVGDEASTEEKFKARIRAFMNRVTDQKSYDFDIVHKEMANPTDLLTKIMEENIKPIEDDFKTTIKEMLGANAREELIDLCHMSIMTQCFGPVLHLRHSKGNEPSFPRPRDMKDNLTVEVLCEHIIKFSLAGIKAFAHKSLFNE